MALLSDALSFFSARICIIDVHRKYTVDKLNNDTIGHGDTPTTYPHDCEAVLRSLYPSADIQMLELKPDFRRAVAQLKRVSSSTDLFVNLYDLADETGQRIVDFLEQSGCAFTGTHIYHFATNELY